MTIPESYGKLLVYKIGGSWVDLLEHPDIVPTTLLVMRCEIE